MNRVFLIGSLILSIAAHGQAFKAAVVPLIEASCIDCHDKDTDTPFIFDEIVWRAQP